MKIQVGAILDNVLTDGPGQRTSVYVSGCSIRCAGCQNDQLFDKTFGDAWDIDALAERLLAPGLPISILGGEPLDQAIQVAKLVIRLKRDPRFVGPLIIYTGYVYEKLTARLAAGGEDYSTMRGLGLDLIFSMVDVLVDGPFMGRNDDDFVQYRGSRNQRPIDLAAMRDAGSMREIMTLDWDTPELRILPDGTIIGAAGFIDLIADADSAVEDARRCGQTQGLGGA